MSDSLWPHELQHTRFPCPSPTPGVHPNPWPSSQWCHPTISSSVIPFSARLQSFPAAAAAKSLQSCPTLCDPLDGSPPGSLVPGILQAITLEWVAISFSNARKWKVKVKLLSHFQPSATPWTAAYQASPSMGFSRQEYWSGVPLPSLIFPSIRVFSNESVLHIRWPKYWSFSFSIRLSNEYSGLISFRIDWFDLCCSRDSQESSPALQFKSTNFWHSAFFMVQLSHLHIATGKTIALTIWTFAGKVLYNKLSRFVIAFLPRSKCLLISWLQSLSTVILEPEKIRSVIVFTFPPFICHEVVGLDAMILVFWVLRF